MYSLFLRITWSDVEASTMVPSAMVMPASTVASVVLRFTGSCGPFARKNWPALEAELRLAYGCVRGNLFAGRGLSVKERGELLGNPKKWVADSCVKGITTLLLTRIIYIL